MTISNNAAGARENARRANGEFGTQARDEADPTLDDTAAVSLTDAMNEEVLDLLDIDSSMFDKSYDFSHVQVTKNNDGTFNVAITSETDVVYGIAEALAYEKPSNYSDADDAYEAAEQWLADNSEGAIAWFEDRTGKKIDRAAEWDSQTYATTTTLPADAMTSDVLEASEKAWGDDAVNESDFYPRMLQDVSVGA